MKRREFITLAGGAVASWPAVGRAQQERVRRIGFLSSIPNDREGQSRLAAFRHGIQALGWIEGVNVQLDVRWGDGTLEATGASATELIGLNPEVILAGSSLGLHLLSERSTTIPIVFVAALDPVAEGVVASFAQPGRNITGFTQFERSLLGKQLEALKEIAPNVDRMAHVFHVSSTTAKSYFSFIEAVAPSLGVRSVAMPIHDAEELVNAIAAFAHDPNGGLLLPQDAFLTTQRALIISETARHSLPAAATNAVYVRSGGLISYGVDQIDIYRQSASYIDRILKGEKPRDLPVQAPTKFELVINLKTAKVLGLTVPQTLLVAANEVIE